MEQLRIIPKEVVIEYLDYALSSEGSSPEEEAHRNEAIRMQRVWGKPEETTELVVNNPSLPESVVARFLELGLLVEVHDQNRDVLESLRSKEAASRVKEEWETLVPGLPLSE